MFTNGLNMSLPQLARVKATVHDVATHLFSGEITQSAGAIEYSDCTSAEG